jgi:hypothetical protein
VNDNDYNFQKKRLQALIKKWVKPAGFAWWRVDFIYSNATHPDNPDVTAETVSNWRYSHASITYYMLKVSEQSDEELEHTFVHELCHLPMSGMEFPDNEQAQAIFEKAVDDYAKHIIWASEFVKVNKGSV